MNLIADVAKQSHSIIIALTESHLRGEIRDAEVSIDGFSLIRADRSDGYRGGGVVMYIKESLVGELRTLALGSNDRCEWIAVLLEQHNIVVVCIYRPPSCPTQKFESVLQLISNELANIGPPNPTILMCGDYNLPMINWVEQGTISGGTLDLQDQARKLKDFAHENFLEQLVQTGTRQQNILDLVFTNNADLVNEIAIHDTVISDHRLMTIATNISLVPDPSAAEIQSGNRLLSLNFRHKSIDWDLISAKHDEVPWDALFESRNTEEMYSVLLEKIEHITSIYVPKRKQPRKSRIPRDRRAFFRKIREARKKLVGELRPWVIDTLNETIVTNEKNLLLSYAN